MQLVLCEYDINIKSYFNLSFHTATKTLWFIKFWSVIKCFTTLQRNDELSVNSLLNINWKGIATERKAVSLFYKKCLVQFHIYSVNIKMKTRGVFNRRLWHRPPKRVRRRWTCMNTLKFHDPLLVSSSYWISLEGFVTIRHPYLIDNSFAFEI